MVTHCVLGGSRLEVIDLLALVLRFLVKLMMFVKDL